MLISEIPNIGEMLKDAAVSNFYKIMIYMSTGIYNMIIWLYAVFINIAKARFVTNSVIQDLTSRLYLLIGIVSLFLVAYSFLMVIVNPDNLTKGKYATSAMIKNIILAVVTITFVPTIFNFSYAVQKSILDKDVIGKIMLDKGSGAVNAGEDGLADLSVSIFETTFYLSGDVNTLNPNYVQQYDNCAALSKTYANISGFAGCTNLITIGAVDYNPLLSILIGLFVIYVLGLYCIDMGLRTIKLVFLQIIAPIPCLLMVVPGQDKVFRKWVQEVFKTFVEVFLKIFVLTLGVYMIQLVTNVFTNYSDEVFGTMNSNAVIIFTKLFIIFGVLMFINKAPKLIGDIFGIDLGYGLSLKKRMDDIKEGFHTLTTPFRPIGRAINRAAGAAMGIAHSWEAHRKAMRKDPSQNTGLKNFLAIYNGARIGRRAGVRGAGAAFSYQQSMEDTYARNQGKSQSEQILQAFGDRSRSFFGRQSYYEEEIMESAIDRDRKIAAYKENIRRSREAVNNMVSDIDNEHQQTLECAKANIDNASAFNDAVTKDVSKQDSNITIGLNEMLNTTKKNLQSDLLDTSKTADEKARIKAKLADIEKAEKAGMFSTEVTTTSPILDKNGQPIKVQQSISTEQFNVDNMLSKIKNVNESDMDEGFKRAFLAVLNQGQDMAKEKYLSSNKDEWSSDVKIAFSNLAQSSTDRDTGNAYVLDLDASGKVQKDANGKVLTKLEKDKVKITCTFKNPDGTTLREEKLTLPKLIEKVQEGHVEYNQFLLKAKKQLSKSYNEEQEVKNTQMTQSTASVQLVDETNPYSANGTWNYKTPTKVDYSLYELKSDDKRWSDYIKAEDLRHEKFTESHESEKQLKELENKRKEMMKKFPKKPGDKK